MNTVLTIPLLQGRLVRLEPLTPDAAPALAEAASGDRSTFTFTQVPDGLAEAKGYVAKILADHAKGRSLPFVVRHVPSGTVAGATRFLNLEVIGAFGETGPAPEDDRPPMVGEIGSTWYAPHFQGTGVNIDAKLLLLTHAFETWGMLRVCLKTDARNERSRRAIAGIGARFEGVRRAEMRAADGGVRDSAYFSLLDSEWAEAKRHLEARVEAVAP